MPWPRILVGLYGLFNIAVGIEAFSKKGSLPSLMGGATIGILLLVCYWIIPSKPGVGYIGATVLCLAIMGQFGRKLSVLWPNQILFGIALVVMLLLLAAHFMSKRAA